MSEFKILYEINKGELFKRDSPRVNSTRPRVLTIMSDENEKWMTAKHLKYFQMPQPSDFPLNLAAGYENYQMRDAKYLKPILSKFANFLVENDGSNFLLNTSKQKIITDRKVLQYLMSTPYRSTTSQKSNFTIKATKFRNIIYLEINKEEGREGDSVMRAYSSKFYRHCFLDSPNSGKPFNGNTRLFGLFRINVDNDDFEILYTAEIYGIESTMEIEEMKNEEALNKCAFVFANLLSKRFLNPRFKKRKDQKFLDFWIRSYLGCVENIYFAFSTESGSVEKMEQMKTHSFPHDQEWEPEFCKRFLRDTLRKIQSTMKEVDCPYTVFEFTFDSEIQAIKYRVFEGKSEHSFLDENFIQYIQKN